MNTSEELCTSSYYSDEELTELDGHLFAEQCREVNSMYNKKKKSAYVDIPLSTL